MATQKQIDSLLYRINNPDAFSKHLATGLRAEIEMPDFGVTADAWKNHFDESLLDKPMNMQTLVFERDSETSPWRFVGEK